MMPTWRRPATMVFCPGPWPCTSADGLSTRRYSAGRLNFLPSSNSTSSRFSARIRRSCTGQGVALGIRSRSGISAGRRKPGAHLADSRLRLLLVAEAARFVDEHDRDAVADRIGKTRLLAHQLLRRLVVAQRRLGQRADENL